MFGRNQEALKLIGYSPVFHFFFNSEYSLNFTRMRLLFLFKKFCFGILFLSCSSWSLFTGKSMAQYHPTNIDLVFVFRFVVYAAAIIVLSSNCIDFMNMSLFVQIHTQRKFNRI